MTPSSRTDLRPLTPLCWSGAPSLTRPLDVVVIGAGNRGRKHASVLQECEATRLVGVCDAEAVALQPYFGAVDTDTDLARLLDRTRPGAAVLVLPHEAYLPVVEECLHRGIVCLKEKPFARNLAEAHSLQSMVRAGAGRLIIAVQRRHGDVMAELADQLRDRASRPVAFEYLYTLGLEPSLAGWRSSASRAGGGAILDMGYHVLDLLTALFGVPDSVAAYPERAVQPGTDVEDGATLMLRYADGMVGTVVLSRCLGPATERATFWLDDASLHFDGQKLVRMDASSHTVLAVHQSSTELLHRQLHKFVERAVAAEEGPALDEDGLAAMSTIDMCYQALEAGQVVHARPGTRQAA